jgi:hypothetical protein
MSLENKCTNCGCTDSYLTTPPPYPAPTPCPFNECAEVQYANCVIYTGDDILCNDDTVVAPNTNIASAIENIVNYFCTEISNLPTVTISEGAGITVTSTVVDNNTEYTISTTGIKKYVKEFLNVIFDNQILLISGETLTECGLLSTSCGGTETKASDFTFNIMYNLNDIWIGLTNEPGVSVQADNATGDISIILDIAPIDPPVTVRVTIIG